MGKLILKQCTCGKTISSNNGDLNKSKCFVCLDKEVTEATRKRTLKEYMGNIKKKVSKPPKNGGRLEKLAGIEE